MAPDAIAQTTTGTSRMRASVMRFGILKSVPASKARPGRSGSEIRHEYNGRRTIARNAIPT